MLNKFAEYLREHREKSGFSLNQLAAKSKIDIKFLEAIDQGNFSFLPELYVKAFIKQYASQIGLDENDALKKYLNAKAGIALDAEEIQPKSANEDQDIIESVPEKNLIKDVPNVSNNLKSYNDPSVQKRDSGRKAEDKSRLILAGAFVGIIFIILLVYFLFLNNSNDYIVTERPIEEVIQESKERYVEDEVIPVQDSVLMSSDSLYLKITSSEVSWIQIIVDDSKTEEFTLSANSSRTVSAVQSFKATIGNSGGVSLSLNEKPVEFSGRSGSVKYIQLDSEGLKYLNTPPKVNQE